MNFVPPVQTGMHQASDTPCPENPVWSPAGATENRKVLKEGNSGPVKGKAGQYVNCMSVTLTSSLQTILNPVIECMTCEHLGQESTVFKSQHRHTCAIYVMLTLFLFGQGN